MSKKKNMDTILESMDKKSNESLKSKHGYKGDNTEKFTATKRHL
ncbi:MAG: hypothetical protein ACRC2K_09485 [Clostridium sp.]